ncbi:MAG TPA: universal stress protein [Planctomycetes bacterium]|nr:universal stress protein [Fuerstiella sp.]HIK94630.1 universal stress protein [Planctomycetota bacterium]
MMISLNRILVTTDFSEFSRPALTYACAMAARFDSELHLLHICPDPAMLVPEADGLGAIDLSGQAQACEEFAIAELQKLPGDGWENEHEVVRATRVGPSFFEIIQYAKELDIDLIVIGTHGRSGLMHLLMGSVAENVVRKAPCPVLTVKPEGHQFVMP